MLDANRTRGGRRERNIFTTNRDHVPRRAAAATQKTESLELPDVDRELAGENCSWAVRPPRESPLRKRRAE
jgi:hypothetical protein